MKKISLFFISILIVGCTSISQKVTEFMPPIVTPMSEASPGAMEATAPAHIALLLPLSGKLDSTSAAFRDGFFDAYYADRSSRKTIITIIDTKDDKNIVASYNLALAKGANFIVGPLTKQGVSTLNASNLITVPTLALNKINLNAVLSDKLYFFSLAPEDEAKQVATQAKKQGTASALIIAEKSDWGERTANAFAKQWQQQGGKVAGIEYYPEKESFEVFIKRALKVYMVGKPGDSKNKPRAGRNDFDMVFFASRAEDARQLRPYISLYYSEKFPVYGTASIYAESQNSTLDRDLNGMVFCDMPWIIEPNKMRSSLRNGLDELWENSSMDFSRLYAMGADAYMITKQFNRSYEVAHFSYLGAAGYLTLSPDHVIQRELVCAKLISGKPHVVR